MQFFAVSFRKSSSSGLTTLRGFGNLEAYIAGSANWKISFAESSKETHHTQSSSSDCHGLAADLEEAEVQQS
jgi:hypothetical protein